eukprot:349877-Chlamydomonas_euryale.AAC.1
MLVVTPIWPAESPANTRRGWRGTSLPLTFSDSFSRAESATVATIAARGGNTTMFLSISRRRALYAPPFTLLHGRQAASFVWPPEHVEGMLTCAAATSVSPVPAGYRRPKTVHCVLTLVLTLLHTHTHTPLPPGAASRRRRGYGTRVGLHYQLRQDQGYADAAAHGTPRRGAGDFQLPGGHSAEVVSTFKYVGS